MLELTNSNTTCTFLDPLNTSKLTLLFSKVITQVNYSKLGLLNNAKNKEHNNMIIQENQIDKKFRGGFNLAILKVKQIHYQRIEVIQQRLRPLTSYCYLEQKTYYRDHVIAPSPQTTSFLDSQQPQVLPILFFFKLFMQ